MQVHENILGTIGNTPMVKLNRLTSGLPCQIIAKLEFFNPGGSVKDRIALPILEGYEQSGELLPGGTVVEATSGNTGVALAIACALKGYQAIFVVPDKMSQEKIQLLRAFGARVVITPAAVAPDDPRSYYSVAERIVEKTSNAVLANQYHNPANPESHRLTTGPEIWEQTGGEVTDVVVGMGTGGTLTGIGQFMRENNHEVRLIGVDPIGSLLYDVWKAGGSLVGLKASTYKIEGIGEDFVPTTLDLGLIDLVVQVDDAEAFRWTRRLVREEGIFCGGSSGAAMAGAVKAAAGLGPERLMVVVFPDSGSRYLSKVFSDDWMRENGFLEIDRRKVPVREIASARGLSDLILATQDDPLQEVIARMRDNGVSQLPVVDGQGRLVGLVSEVDLLDHMLKSDRDAAQSIAPMVNPDVGSVFEADPLEEVLPELVTRKVIVLTDETGGPVGIVTVIDALEYIATQDE
ncbi:MAG: pyridoxal-phosphate dependent enzyme [Chloroflexi bacterium]|nr:pyridoxal-phosphate dependent enzyme [Chloroflexota bacterium]MCI0773389.1 pyridoxal-phosphate dependent enzyme [Chloroflexota bacterium]MCI0854004.1 pyridoxal-phosphate dependent enzyme [Chloroflexota bacterium]MCI0875495.1 pyridoxal-phosphate dependent enzyme [Chloroflexota bacterium]MCI0892421.1 pyridoxal-phosphate dependent enzyme [Chloroflexota bacterium]